MGKKGKGSQKNQKAKSVFKVATGRSVKLKAKAQKVMTNLKKLDVKGKKQTNKGKTAEIDRQLQEIRKEASKPKAKPARNIIRPARFIKEDSKKAGKATQPVQTDKAASLVQKMQI